MRRLPLTMMHYARATLPVFVGVCRTSCLSLRRLREVRAFHTGPSQLRLFSSFEGSDHFLRMPRAAEINRENDLAQHK